MRQSYCSITLIFYQPDCLPPVDLPKGDRATARNDIVCVCSLTPRLSSGEHGARDDEIKSDARRVNKASFYFPVRVQERGVQIF